MYLVTGGAGFIGSHIVESLLNEGKSVRVIDNYSTGKKANLELLEHRPGLEILEGDIRDFAVLEEVMDGIEGIFHQAAMVYVEKSINMPAESFSNNCLGTFNVFEAARKKGIGKIIFASSAAVYGHEYTQPVPEDIPCRPGSPYALDKYYAENLASIYFRLYGLESVALRYFNVFGPRQNHESPYSGVISVFRSNISAGQIPTIQGDGTQTRDFIYIKDVARANLLAMKTPINNAVTMNIGTGVSTSILALLKNIYRLAGRNCEYHTDKPREGDIKHSVANIEIAKKILNWRPAYTLDTGLAEMNE